MIEGFHFLSTTELLATENAEKHPPGFTRMFRAAADWMRNI